MNAFDYAVVAPRQMLTSLSAQLERGVLWAAQQGTSVDELLRIRLAPDMFPLSTQVKFVCVQARETPCRLIGRTIPTIECGDTLGELQPHIAETLAFLGALTPADFAGAEARSIALALPNGAVFEMTGEAFIRDWAVPQFYFHAITTYALLRHAGVPLGKADYVPHMLAHMRAPKPE